MAKKLSEAAVGDNVTDKTRLEFWKKALAAKQALEEAQTVVSSANGEYRAVLKAAKKAGVEHEEIARLLNERHQDQDEITAKQQAYMRFRVLIGAYVPTKQSDIFADAQKGDDIDASRAYDDGLFSGSHGENRGNNKHPPGSETYDAWDRGWIAGQAQMAAKMKPVPAPRVPRRGKQNGAEASPVN
jgi:hypothetical protein